MNEFSIAVSVISGCITIVSGIYAFTRWVSRSRGREPSARPEPPTHAGDHKRSEWAETTAMGLVLFGGLFAVGGTLGNIARVGLGLPQDEGLLVMMIAGGVAAIVGVLIMLIVD
jgi:hypothetical protein